MADADIIIEGSGMGGATLAVGLTRVGLNPAPSHQCGGARIGYDPAKSVCDPFGRSHDHPNLYVCDTSLLPTSAAVNPSLTIAGLALRQADHLKETVQ